MIKETHSSDIAWYDITKVLQLSSWFILKNDTLNQYAKFKKEFTNVAFRSRSF